MAHFAELDENNVVLQVIVVHNNELVESKETTVNPDGSVSVSVVESEQKGIDFCKSLFGQNTNWVQTSYNENFRGKYAGVGDTFENGIFVTPPAIGVQQFEFPQQTDSVAAMGSSSMPTIASTDIQPLTSSNLSSLQSGDVQALSSSNISALTTGDISSLG